MKISEIIENDEEHVKTLRQTGFWGAAGAGCIIFARSTGRFLLQHRSRYVEQPNTYGTWGGAIDRGDSPEATVKKEVQEESGYTGLVKLHPIFVFQKGDFKYFNFVAEIEDEFEPRLNWEAEGYIWVEYGEWPEPLHFGIQAILNDSKSIQVMKNLVKRQRQLQKE